MFTNLTLICSITGWALAQFLKVLVHLRFEHKWDWRQFTASGGMPSSHTSFVVSLAVMVGGTCGFGSPEFAICVVLASIVMYDATGVRRETGRQAEIINEILRHAIKDGAPIRDEELKEMIGHSPIQVLGGVLVGILVACLFLLFT